MKTNALYGVSLAIAMAFSTACFAESAAQGDSGNGSQSAPAASGGAGSEATSSQQYGQGGSKHCDQLSDAAKRECLQDEGAKTEREQESAAAAPDASASGGSSPGRETAPDAKGLNATQTND